MLGLVLVFLVTFLASPLQQYFEQRAQINAVRADIAATQERITQARTDLQRWQDPAYVRAQARERLHFVVPGETQYIVVDANGDGVATDDPQLPVVERISGEGTWYGRIISSIEIAAYGGTGD